MNDYDYTCPYNCKLCSQQEVHSLAEQMVRGFHAMIAKHTNSDGMFGPGTATYGVLIFPWGRDGEYYLSVESGRGISSAVVMAMRVMAGK